MISAEGSSDEDLGLFYGAIAIFLGPQCLACAECPVQVPGLKE